MTEIQLNWPLALKPGAQSFYIRTVSTRFDNPLTGQVQVLERDAARWVFITLRMVDIFFGKKSY